MTIDQGDAPKLLGPGTPESDDGTSYYRRMEKAMETMRQAVMDGTMGADEVMELADKVERQPLTRFDFFDTESGEELNAHGIYMAWHNNSIADLRASRGRKAVFDKEQEVARTLADRIFGAYDVYNAQIQAQYGPFAKHVDAGALIHEAAAAGASEADKAVLSDPENLAFVRDKVWGLAVPNLAYVRRMRDQVVGELGFKKQ